MVVFDTGLRGSLEERANHLWEILSNGYQELGTTAGELLSYTSFCNIFKQ